MAAQNYQVVLYGCEIIGFIGARKCIDDGAVFLKRCYIFGILFV